MRPSVRPQPIAEPSSAAIAKRAPPLQSSRDPVISALSREQLVRRWQTGGDLDAVRARIAARLAELAEHRRDSKNAARWRARAGLSQPASRKQTRKIAVLLPLSGPHAAIGQRLKGPVLAGASIERVDVIMLDTRGDAEVAAARVTEAYQAGAMAILGPIGTRESMAAATRAVNLGVVIAPLSPGLGGSRQVFGLVGAHRAEARGAANFAAASGATHVAVLYPRDDVRQQQGLEFSRMATAHGLVVHSFSYDPSGIDLETDIRAALGLNSGTNARYRRHLGRYGKSAWKSFVPRLRWDLMYIADEDNRGALVASYLPYFNVELRNSAMMDVQALRHRYRGQIPSVVQIVGGGEWSAETAAAAGGSHLEGAIVVTPCARGDTAAFEGTVRGEIERARGGVATDLELMSHDASRFLAGAVALASKRGWSVASAAQRTTVRDWACAAMRLGGDFRAIRRPYVYRLEGGEWLEEAG